MAKCTKTESFYMLYRIIEEDALIKVKDITKRLNFSGRGKARSTISRRIIRMYEKKISRNPQLTLKPFKNVQTTVYFCRKKVRKDFNSTFHKLHNNNHVNYILYLSGDCDFFIASRDEDLDLGVYDLDVKEKSKLFTPVFTVPHGWNLPMKDALKSFINCDFAKGTILRERGETLHLKQLDWKIYEAMKENIRTDFNSVARGTGVYPETVKAHFHKKVLPACTILHYFFPKGYDFYRQAFLRIHTKYEKSLVKALEKLPCTTYVYPLEKGMALNVFHEDSNDLMSKFKKLEEMGILDHYLLYTPISSAV